MADDTISVTTTEMVVLEITDGITKLKDLALGIEDRSKAQKKQEVIPLLLYYLQLCYKSESYTLELVSDISESKKILAGIEDLRNIIYHLRYFFETGYEDSFSG
jgi:hypothetical protein